MSVVLILRHRAVCIFYSVIQISNETGFNQLSDGDSKKQYIFFVSLCESINSNNCRVVTGLLPAAAGAVTFQMCTVQNGPICSCEQEQHCQSSLFQMGFAISV